MSGATNSVIAFVDIKNDLVFGLPLMNGIENVIIAQAKAFFDRQKEQPENGLALVNFAVELSGIETTAQVNGSVGSLVPFGSDVHVYIKTSEISEEIFKHLLLAFGYVLEVEPKEIFDKVKAEKADYACFTTVYDRETSLAMLGNVASTMKKAKINTDGRSVIIAYNPIRSKSQIIQGFLVKESDKMLANSPMEIKDKSGKVFAIAQNIRALWGYITAPFTKKLDKSIVFLMGLPGSGKSTFAKALAEHYGIEYVQVIVPEVEQGRQFFFSSTIQSASSQTTFTPLAKALFRETNEPLVVLFDEINRVPTEVTNILLPLFDDQDSFPIGHGQIGKIVRPVLFVVTSNVGSKYVGTDLIDPALRNRFTVSEEMKPLTAEQISSVLFSIFSKNGLDKQAADNYANLISRCAEIVSEANSPQDISIRQAISLVKLIYVAETDPTIAFTAAIINNQPQNIRQSLMAVGREFGMR